MSNKGNLSILGLLALINVLNFIDRQLLASFGNYIIPDLQLTNQQFGLLTGLVFLFFYCVGGLFMGALADRVHRPRLLAAAVALWSALTAASGAAKSFTGMMIPRLFIGIGESAATPTSISILADRFPQKNMGLVTGIYYLGVPIGVAVSLLIVGYLGPVIGWRNCFYLLGGIGLGLSVLVLLIPETRGVTPDSQAAPATPAETMTFKHSFALLTKTIAGSTALKTIFWPPLPFISSSAQQPLIRSGWFRSAGLTGMKSPSPPGGWRLWAAFWATFSAAGAAIKCTKNTA